MAAREPRRGRLPEGKRAIAAVSKAAEAAAQAMNVDHWIVVVSFGLALATPPSAS
jgi:hypothetical protein